MNEVLLQVGPAGDDWRLSCDLPAESIYFRSGAKAEAAGRGLAVSLSQGGCDVRLMVMDRRDLLVATHRYYGA